jgi:hypothetical protein
MVEDSSIPLLPDLPAYQESYGAQAFVGGVLGVEVTLIHQSLVEVVGVHSLGSRS